MKIKPRSPSKTISNQLFLSFLLALFMLTGSSCGRKLPPPASRPTVNFMTSNGRCKNELIGSLNELNESIETFTKTMQQEASDQLQIGQKLANLIKDIEGKYSLYQGVTCLIRYQQKDHPTKSYDLNININEQMLLPLYQDLQTLKLKKNDSGTFCLREFYANLKTLDEKKRNLEAELSKLIYIKKDDGRYPSIIDANGIIGKSIGHLESQINSFKEIIPEKSCAMIKPFRDSYTAMTRIKAENWNKTHFFEIQSNFLRNYQNLINDLFDSAESYFLQDEGLYTRPIRKFHPFNSTQEYSFDPKGVEFFFFQIAHDKAKIFLKASYKGQQEMPALFPLKMMVYILNEEEKSATLLGKSVPISPTSSIALLRLISPKKGRYLVKIISDEPIENFTDTSAVNIQLTLNEHLSED